MPRYIDADSLKQRVMNNWYTATDIIDDIDAEPTADVYDVLEDYVTDDTHVDIVIRMLAYIWEKMNPGFRFVYEVRGEKIWNTPTE